MFLVNIWLFLKYLCISLAISGIFFLILVKLLKSSDKSCRKESRHIHASYASRFGGLAMIASFVISLLASEIFFDKPMKFMLLALAVIFMIGILDDLKELNYFTQFLWQVIIGLIIVFSGIKIPYIRNPFGGIVIFNYWMSGIFVIVWIAVLMNITNWLDGIDGLAGGVSGIGFLAIFFLSLRPEINQPPIAIMSIILFGIALGFLLFNFYPAKIMMGTTGSMFLGFMLAFLSILGGSKVATAMLILALPIVDAGWVVYQRIKHKKSIFKADKSHLHYRLLELGLSQRQITLLAYFLTAIFASFALFLSSLLKVIILLLLIVIFIPIFYYIDFVLQLNDNK